jgi:hypothetical protein
VVFWADGANPNPVNSNTTITDTIWHHVAVTRSGVDYTFYIDGIERGTGTMTGSFNNNLDPVVIGDDGEPGSAIGGNLDELRLSSASRSAEWIQAEVCTAGGVVGGTGSPQYPAVTSAVAEITPNAVAASSTGNAFTYDILPFVGASDTGVNQVVITAPAGYANMNVTAVSLGGAGKSANCPNPAGGQYCASIAGQAITVTLGDQAGDGQVIQVVFDADAPGTPGSADFSATVDDAATPVAAQAATAGNADGDGPPLF